MDTSSIDRNSLYKKLFLAEGFLVILAILPAYWFVKTGYTEYGNLFTCTFRQATGYVCPGCGGTRALYELLQGHIFCSFCLHPIVLYTVCVLLLAPTRYLIKLHLQKKSNKKISIQLHLQRYAYLAIVIILLQWFVKLILQWNGIVFDASLF